MAFAKRTATSCALPRAKVGTSMRPRLPSTLAASASIASSLLVLSLRDT